MTSAYQSRSPVSSGSRPLSPDWGWQLGWCWWASAAGYTVDITGGSNWDITPHPSHTHQQVGGGKTSVLSKILASWQIFLENITSWWGVSGVSHQQLFVLLFKESTVKSMTCFSPHRRSSLSHFIHFILAIVEKLLRIKGMSCCAAFNFLVFNERLQQSSERRYWRYLQSYMFLMLFYHFYFVQSDGYSQRIHLIKMHLSPLGSIKGKHWGHAEAFINSNCYMEFILVYAHWQDSST